MSQLQSILDQLKVSKRYGENASLLGMLLNSLNQNKYHVSNKDISVIAVFVCDEMEKLLDLIHLTSDYKIKDELFYYVDKLMELFMFVKDNHYDVSESYLDVVKALANKVNEERFLETSIDNLFKLDKIDKEHINKVIDLVKSLTNEYQRGKFYQGLLNYQNDIIKFTAEAKYEVINYICTEFERYLEKKNNLSDDEINNLEIAVDICKYFIDDKIIVLLKEILNLNHNNIRYYAIDTLLIAKQKIEENIIIELANDLVYANLTYGLLEKFNQVDLFPKELTSREYLAKSDMVRWLVYPTELGKVPDMIELLGDVKVKGEIYFIFKYKSDSDNLSDDLKDQWLIGWSSNDGGTFSNFDKLSLFEQKNLKKTLKVIKKKLIG